MWEMHVKMVLCFCNLLTLTKSLTKEPHFGKYVFIYNFLTVALPELIRLQQVSELLMSLFSCQGDNNS